MRAGRVNLEKLTTKAKSRQAVAACSGNGLNYVPNDTKTIDLNWTLKDHFIPVPADSLPFASFYHGESTTLFNLALVDDFSVLSLILNPSVFRLVFAPMQDILKYMLLIWHLMQIYKDNSLQWKMIGKLKEYMECGTS